VNSNIGSWGPVIVDQPILDFEPKPPVGRLYFPDTVCDGWSTDHLTLRMASVRGYSHRYSGLPRQDDAEIAYDSVSGSVAFAVADGVSSAPHSQVGARIACQSAVDMIFRELNCQDAASFSWSAVINKTSEALVRQADMILNQQDVTLETATACLGTTLIAGYISPSAEGLLSEVARVGDSSSWVLQRGMYYPTFETKSTDNLISSSVSPLPRIPEVISVAKVRIGGDSVFLIGTDGFGDPLGDGDGMVGRLFAEHLSTVPPTHSFAHLLDFSRETFDDDRTLIGVWPTSVQERPVRLWKLHQELILAA
jgi:serine/threonine protein phosphatase PrpC